MEVGHSIACVRSFEFVVAVLLAIVFAELVLLAFARFIALASTGGVFAG